MNLYILRLAVRAAELFIDLLEVIMEWWSDVQCQEEEAEAGDSIDS